MSIEKIFDQPISINQHTRIDFSFNVSDNCISIASQPGIFQTNLPLLETFIDLYKQVLSPLQHFSRNYVFLLSTTKEI